MSSTLAAPAPFRDPTRDLSRAWVALAWVTGLAAAIFTLRPEVDIAVSALFFDPVTQTFPLADPVWAQGLRWTIRYLSDGTALLAVIGLVCAALGRPLLGLGARLWGWILLLYVMAPGLLVNLVLKQVWGRARPAQIAEFGGTQSFTPALLPTDQCPRNCSFVTGEGAAATALAISVAAIVLALGPRISPGRRRAAIAAGVAVAVVGSGLRIMAGRHFLSDIVFAVIVVLAVAFALLAMFPPRPAGR